MVSGDTRGPGLPHKIVTATRGNHGQSIAFAALMQERERQAGRKIGVILTGGNVDAEVFRRVLGG